MEKRFVEMIRNYNVDIIKLKQEQERLAKSLEIKDSIDFSLIERIGGCDVAFFKNRIVAVVVVLDKSLEIIEQVYSTNIVKFPYVPGFEAYREMPEILNAFNKIQEKPDILFVPSHGIDHPRLGMASHISLAVQIPTIGIAKKPIPNSKISGEDIIKEKKIVGKLVTLKPGSKPVVISPGNLITLKTAIDLTKKFTIPPHKMPEPLHIASRYADKIISEIRPKEQ